MPRSSGDEPYGEGFGEAGSLIANCVELRDSTLVHFA
jgi:hypothetical protein